ncbi:hypothetical protein BAE44_0022972 [Dichanthelium oligosanthes]|uniref:Uncharacterized protein n=1 Tax=Dichanthelium oligosanthes TaxID=888268 RepID=A0A1E5UT23_9POAL|nr:hypothetical protein BAE44_0022972 [Dichanthelium oligosanthes]
MDVDGEAPSAPASSGARPVDVAGGGGEEEDTLPGVVRGFVDGVWSPGGDEPLLRRLRAASCEAAPRLRGASRNSARDLLEWTRRGSGLRAILVISVGTITLIALTGLLIFMFFLLVATANAVIVSVLMSLAAAGGFLAIFFACLVAVYIGAVSVAVFTISATVISATIGVMIATGKSSFFPSNRLMCRRYVNMELPFSKNTILSDLLGPKADIFTSQEPVRITCANVQKTHPAAGWVGFFWMVWFTARKSMDLTKHSIGMTSSVIQSYSASRHMNQKPVD